MTGVQLAGDLGYGVPWLTFILAIAIIVTTAFFIFVSLSPRIKGKSNNHIQANDIKHKLFKYHAERYWAILVAGILIWFWFLGYPWMPPVAFEKGLSSTNNTVHLVNVTAGQWFWQFKDGGIVQNNISDSNSMISKNDSSASSVSQPIKLKVGETVKFVAHSLDVNHGFGVLKSSKSMDSPLFQMQVVPGYDNEFYYTFKEPGVYTIRCLEYCGWNHPYMTSQITVVAAA
jgi:heme/copper-type cytochrome/quinol oxidase subunit 2